MRWDCYECASQDAWRVFSVINGRSARGNDMNNKQTRRCEDYWDYDDVT